MNTTAGSDVVYALCYCCTGHGGNDRLLPKTITCPTCGASCSCEGCVADADHHASEAA